MMPASIHTITAPRKLAPRRALFLLRLRGARQLFSTFKRLGRSGWDIGQFLLADMASLAIALGDRFQGRWRTSKRSLQYASQAFAFKPLRSKMMLHLI